MSNFQSTKFLPTIVERGPLADKLLQTKLREKEVKAALKEQREEKKAEKEEERLEAAEAARFERAFHHNSKQYEADVRRVSCGG